MKKNLKTFLCLFASTSLYSTIKIDYLKNHPELVETCATWSFNEWGRFTPDRPLNDYIESRKQYCNDNTLPLTILAFDEDAVNKQNNKPKPIGMVSLHPSRLPGNFPHLTPWLATLYVVPEYRGKHIGQLLVKEICNKAKEMNYTKIYVFTSDPNLVPWYEKLGWEYMDKVIKKTDLEHEVTVLSKDL